MITDTMYIGSGDVSALLSGIHTEAYSKLLGRFVSGIRPYYNAKASPIDALRTGAIIEERFGLILPDDYYPQYKVISKEMDVFKASLDFAKINTGTIIGAKECKSISFADFLEFEQFRDNPSDALPYVQGHYKGYYNQVQEQIYCTGLMEIDLVFIAVYSYSDEDNYNREIKENEYITIPVPRDDKVISLILNRGKIFQQIKDYHVSRE